MIPILVEDARPIRRLLRERKLTTADDGYGGELRWLREARPDYFAKRGMTVDETAEAIWDAGYVAERPSGDETLELLEWVLTSKGFVTEEEDLYVNEKGEVHSYEEPDPVKSAAAKVAVGTKTAREKVKKHGKPAVAKEVLEDVIFHGACRKLLQPGGKVAWTRATPATSTIFQLVDPAGVVATAYNTKPSAEKAWEIEHSWPGWTIKEVKIESESRRKPVVSAEAAEVLCAGCRKLVATTAKPQPAAKPKKSAAA